MVRMSRSNFSVAAVASAFLAAAGVPALADEALNNFGPVGPREPILISNGTQRVIAFYEPERDTCAVSAVIPAGGVVNPSASKATWRR